MQSQPNLNPDTSMWDWLTDDLRFHVKKSDMKVVELAKILHREASSVSNILAGRRRINDADAMKLDKMWGLNGHFGRLLRYARRKSDEEWFGQYKEQEALADVIKTYQAMAFPGLLQLPEYARALFEASGADSDEVDLLLSERMDRQQIFLRKPPPMYWVLITESVLDWPLGGIEVIRKQLAHVLEVIQSPKIGLRVVPKSVGAHAGFDGSFSVIYGEVGEIAYSEAPGGGRLVPSAPEARRFGVRFDRIGQVALPEQPSVALIQRALEAL